MACSVNATNALYPSRSRAGYLIVVVTWMGFCIARTIAAIIVSEDGFGLTYYTIFMNEIYWITRIGVLSDFSLFFSIVIGISLFVTIPFYVSSCIDEDEDVKPIYKRVIKICSVLLPIFILLSIFVPSKKDLLLMYGIGGTIDYIRDNDTAKQLPDKCIKALDMYLDEMMDKDE